MSRTELKSGSLAGNVVLRRVLRSITQMDGLLILLAALYFVVAYASIPQPRAYVLTIVWYGALALVLHRLPALRARPRETLVTAVAAMVVFITSLLAFSGGGREPLLNLYLLPIVTSGLTLTRSATLLTVWLVLAGRITLSHFVYAEDVLTLAYGLSLLTEAVPVLLVALLTNMLATDIRDINDRLLALADSDEVTGLLNLPAFTRLLGEERERAARRAASFAILFVDVEGLRKINDRHGHEAGNTALAAVARAMARSCRSADLVARYGGDEFVVFVSEAGPGAARSVANRIRHNVATTTLEVSGRVERLTVSIGEAIFPADGQQLRDLINCATKDMERDKCRRQPAVSVATESRAAAPRAAEA